MEKNISSHDASDMLTYEEMFLRSRRLYLKNSLGLILREKFTASVSHMHTYMKQVGAVLFEIKNRAFSSTSVTFFSVFIAAWVMMVFWFVLLLGSTS